MALSFTLDSVAAADRPAVLQRAFAEYSIPLRLHLARHDALRATFEATSMGAVRLEHFAIAGASGSVERPEMRSAGSAPALLTAHVITGGTAELQQNGRTSTPGRGQIVLSTTELPFGTSQRGSSGQRTFSVTYDDLGVPSQSIRNLAGSAFARDDALASTVAAHLVRMSRAVLASDDPAWNAMAGSTIDMLRALVLSAADLDAREPLARTLADRVIAYLSEHATDATLTPSRLASVHHISLRYLYVILAKRGIVLGDWLRDRRLQIACTMLEDRSLDRLTISQIAQAVGFADHPHFTRSFRSRHAMTPSEWRRASAHEGQSRGPGITPAQVPPQL